MLIFIQQVLVLCMGFDDFRIIYDKIDKDSDGKVSEEELEKWIKYVQTRYIRVDTDRQWSEHNPDDSATLSWKSYRHKVYAFVEGSVTEQLLTISDY